MITSKEPKVSPTGRYSINDTCQILGIHRNTLLSYTLNGKIKCKFRASNDKKFYTGSEIKRFWSATK